MRRAPAVAADIVVVLVFVVIGRANHHDGESLAGIASTAWPFLAGLAVGEVVAGRAWRQPAGLFPAGVVIWAATVTGGQVLRILSGQGTELAFVAVSAAFLGLFLLGWRALALIPAARSRTAGRSHGESPTAGRSSVS